MLKIKDLDLTSSEEMGKKKQYQKSLLKSIFSNYLQCLKTNVNQHLLWSDKRNMKCQFTKIHTAELTFFHKSIINISKKSYI